MLNKYIIITTWFLLYGFIFYNNNYSSVYFSIDNVYKNEKKKKG